MRLMRDQDGPCSMINLSNCLHSTTDHGIRPRKLLCILILGGPGPVVGSSAPSLVTGSGDAKGRRERIVSLLLGCEIERFRGTVRSSGLFRESDPLTLPVRRRFALEALARVSRLSFSNPSLSSEPSRSSRLRSVGS